MIIDVNKSKDLLFKKNLGTGIIDWELIEGISSALNDSEEEQKVEKIMKRGNDIWISQFEKLFLINI